MSDPSTPSEPSQPAVPAGWYADPAGGGGSRWWDGTAWTEHVQAPTPPAPPAPPPPAPPVPPTPAEPPSPPVATPAPGDAAGSAYGTAAPSAAPAYGSAPAYGAGAAYGAGSAYGGAPGYAPAYAAGYVQPRRVGFGDAVRRAFSGWGDYTSRATVAEYWWFVLFELLVSAVLTVLFVAVLGTSFSTTTTADGTTNVTSTGASAVGVLVIIVMTAVSIVLFLVSLALTVRRLHDSDKTGWWYLIVFVPFGSLVLLIFTLLPGTPGPNRFGPVPQ